MEFIVKTDIAGMMPEVIDFNHEELKIELAGHLEKYKNLVVTEDAIAAAKADRAKLNKFKEALESKRKEVKASCMAPYLTFEAKVKELVAMVEEPILAIDGQAKAFDGEKKQAKEAEIKAFYASSMEELALIIPIEKIWSPRWLNVTYKMAEIEAEITAFRANIEKDLAAIKAMKSEYEAFMMDAYVRTLNISDAIAEQAKYEERKKRIEELEAQKEAARKKIEAAAENEAAISPKITDAPPEIIQMDFRVWATIDQLNGLKKYLVDNKIKYGRV